MRLTLLLLPLLGLSTSVVADDKPNPPPPAEHASASGVGPTCPAFRASEASVSVEDVPPIRLGDGTCVKVLDADQTVSFGGKPAVTVGARVVCANGRIGVVTGGASSVFVGGRSLATAQSRIVGCEDGLEAQ